MYQCRDKGCTRIDKDDLDALVEEAMLGYLSDPDLGARLEGAAADDDRLRQVRGDLKRAGTNLPNFAPT